LFCEGFFWVVGEGDGNQNLRKIISVHTANLSAGDMDPFLLLKLLSLEEIGNIL
jgi:hypothetical protein